MSESKMLVIVASDFGFKRCLCSLTRARAVKKFYLDGGGMDYGGTIVGSHAIPIWVTDACAATARA